MKEDNGLVVLCPSCGSADVKLVEKRSNNGVAGPGYVSWVVDSYQSCQTCGTRFDHTFDK